MPSSFTSTLHSSSLRSSFHYLPSPLSSYYPSEPCRYITLYRCNTTPAANERCNISCSVAPIRDRFSTKYRIFSPIITALNRSTIDNNSLKISKLHGPLNIRTRNSLVSFLPSLTYHKKVSVMKSRDEFAENRQPALRQIHRIRFKETNVS